MTQGLYMLWTHGIPIRITRPMRLTQIRMVSVPMKRVSRTVELFVGEHSSSSYSSSPSSLTLSLSSSYSFSSSSSSIASVDIMALSILGLTGIWKMGLCFISWWAAVNMEVCTCVCVCVCVWSRVRKLAPSFLSPVLISIGPGSKSLPFHFPHHPVISTQPMLPFGNNTTNGTASQDNKRTYEKAHGEN